MNKYVLNLLLVAGIFGSGYAFAEYKYQKRLVLVSENVGAYVQEHQQIAVAKDVYEIGLQRVVNKAKVVGE